MLRIHLFGEGSLDFGDGPRPADALPKSLPLLALLLIGRGRPIPRDRIAFALWPDDDEDAALANLRRHLFRLIRSLPNAPANVPWVLSSRKTVQWNPQAAYWLDLAEFERLCADSARGLEALELFRGGFLTGVEATCLEPERSRLKALLRDALTVSYDVAMRAHRLAVGLECANALFALDPEDETALRRLMSVRYESGNRSGALAEFERFAAALYDEFGERPMPETVALAERIGDGGALERAMPQLVATQADTSPASVPNALPFVGRSSELDALASAWEHALAGHGSVVFVTGEAGIGKSRLVDTFAQRCLRDGGSIFLGRTPPVEAQPYEVVAQALRSALPVILDRTTDALWLGAIAGIVPEVIARRPDVARPPQLDDRAERARLFEAIARVIGDAARSRPRFVILEDVHWATGATFDAIDDLANRLDAMRVLVVLTARDDLAADHPLHRVRTRISRAGRGTTIALGPLAKVDIADLLRDRGERDVDERSAELYERTDGHPLFLALSLDDEHAGGTLADAIDRKFSALSSDARAFAEFASVAGVGFDLDLVLQISAWPESRALAALDELIDRRVVRGSNAIRFADFAFAHALFWSWAYDRMQPSRRQFTHRRAARALVAAAAVTPALSRELARHYEGSEQWNAAATAFTRAAEYAARVGANDEALAFASKALDLATEPIVALPARALREKLYARVGNRDAQLRDLVALEAYARESDDPDALCDARSRRAAFAQAGGDREAVRIAIDGLETAVRRAARSRWDGELALVRARMEVATGDMGRAALAVEAALAAFGIEDDAEGSLRALTLAAEIASSRGEYDVARTHLAQAADIAARFVEPVPLLQVLRSTAAASFIARDFASTAASTREALSISQRIGDVASEAELLARLASLAARGFDVSEARSLYERARLRYATLDNRRAIAGTILNAAMVEFAVGNVAHALDALRDAERRFCALDDLRGSCLAVVNASLALSYLGRHAEAIASARRGLEIARGRRDPLSEAQALSNLGAAYRRSEAFDAAYASLNEALALRRLTASTVDLAEDLCDLALTCLGLGRPTEAQGAVDEYLPYIDVLCAQSLFAQDLCFAAALALDATGDERARAFGTRAERIVAERALRLPDAEARTNFLDFGMNPAIRAWARGRNVDGAPIIVA